MEVNTIKYFIFIALFIISGCSSEMDFETADALYGEQYNLRALEANEYIRQRMEYENSIDLDAKGDCYAIPGNGITQILVISSEGVIESVIANEDNEKSRCFKKSYLGTKYKAPPFSPFYRKMKMGYGLKSA